MDYRKYKDVFLSVIKVLECHKVEVADVRKVLAPFCVVRCFKIKSVRHKSVPKLFSMLNRKKMLTIENYVM